MMTQVGRDLQTTIPAIVEQIGRRLDRENVCHIPFEVQSFLESILVEAVRFRAAEGAEKRIPTQDEPELLEYLAGVVGHLIEEASAREQYEFRQGTPVITLISVIEVIQSEWCNIWPFCRSFGAPTQPGESAKLPTHEHNI